MAYLIFLRQTRVSCPGILVVRDAVKEIKRQRFELGATLLRTQKMRLSFFFPLIEMF